MQRETETHQNMGCLVFVSVSMLSLNPSLSISVLFSVKAQNQQH